MASHHATVSPFPQRRSSVLALARVVYLVTVVSRESRPAREPTTDELRDMLGYGGPKFDPMPEFLGFIAHVLLVVVMLWALGWSF